jgi:hypothetical protein
VRAAFVWSRYQPAVAGPSGGLDSCSGLKERILQKRPFVLGCGLFNDAFQLCCAGSNASTTVNT